MWIPDRLDERKPLYQAIADALERDIGSGKLGPGTKIPTQRELARRIGVDLSTVTRAYKEIERRGLISATVGKGTFVAADVGVSVPLVRGEVVDSGLLEMGLVLPLYALENETIEAARASMAAADLARYLRYADPRGLPEHREIGAAWVGRAGFPTDAEGILVASGTQNGLASVLMALLKPGDRIAVDALTYPGLKTLAPMLGLRLVPIAMDREGMLPESLEAACRREAIRALYLMPETQNPTAIALPDDRRAAIAGIVERHDLVLLEDDAYGETLDERRPALGASVPERTVFFGGISKAFGAGLRVCFVAAPRRHVAAIERAILASVWMASPLCVAIVAGIIASGAAEKIASAKRNEARRRSALAATRLAGRSFRCPPSGFFGWLELPPPWSGREFELAARQAGVRVFCAEKFAVGGQAPAAVRLSLSGPETLGDLGRGLDIVAATLLGARGRLDAVF